MEAEVDMEALQVSAMVGTLLHLSLLLAQGMSDPLIYGKRSLILYFFVFKPCAQNPRLVFLK